MALHVSRAGVDPERVIGELAGDEAAGFRLVEADDDVDLAARQRGQLRQRHELESHARVALGEVAQRPRQVVGREPVRRADPHIAGEFEIDAGHLALRMQEGALHLLGCGEETLAGAGELRAGRAPVEEFCAERRLERRDPAADGRVIELEALGRGDELPGAGDGEEDPDVVPVHPAILMKALERRRRCMLMSYA